MDWIKIGMVLGGVGPDELWQAVEESNWRRISVGGVVETAAVRFTSISDMCMFALVWGEHGRAIYDERAMNAPLYRTPARPLDLGLLGQVLDDTTCGRATIASCIHACVHAMDATTAARLMMNLRRRCRRHGFRATFDLVRPMPRQRAPDGPLTLKTVHTVSGRG